MSRPRKKHLEGQYPLPSARPSRVEGGSLPALARPSGLMRAAVISPHLPSFAQKELTFPDSDV